MDLASVSAPWLLDRLMKVDELLVLEFSGIGSPWRTCFSRSPCSVLFLPSTNEWRLWEREALDLRYLAPGPSDTLGKSKSRSEALARAFLGLSEARSLPQDAERLRGWGEWKDLACSVGLRLLDGGTAPFRKASALCGCSSA